MSRILRIYTALGFVLAFSPVSFAEARSGALEGADLTVSVRLYNYAHVSPNEMARAQKSAARILNSAGLKTVWLDCPWHRRDSARNKACRQPLGPTGLFIRILSRRMGSRLKFPRQTLGIAFLPRDGGPGRYASVFYHRIKDASRYSYFTRGEILGHVLAHEIGHLLLGSGNRFLDGIMHAHWSSRRRQLVVGDELCFTTQQGEIIREEVLARTLLAKSHQAVTLPPRN